MGCEIKEEIIMAGMVVQHNMNALNAYNRLNVNVNGLKKSSEKLSSGYRINRAGDDAAGLAISEKMRSQIRGLNQAKRNSQDGISMIQTFEGALQESHSILQRMKELATESANGTYDNATDRAAIQLEFDQLNDELNQIADTDFNGTVALNGGIMADGTKANGSAIDYTKNFTEPRELTKDDVTIGNLGYAGTANETVTFTATKDKDTGAVTWTKSDNGVGTVTNKAEGGFAYDGATFGFDTDKVNTGDTLTVTFTKGKAAVAASNPAAVDIYIEDNDSKATFAGGVTAEDISGSIKSEEDRDLVNSLNGASIGFTTDATGKLSAATVTLADGSVIEDTTGTATVSNPLSVKVAGNKLEIYGFIGGANKKIATIDGSAANDDFKSKTGEMSLVFTDAKYAPAEIGTITVEASAVSKSNAYDASVAKMTYADSVTLQVGARTKDAVDFTFNYESDGMGELEANMNVSAREDGLNTANLSLANQEDANYAIDQIDNAINKVSMVRATFGSIQNRLEHKIENITTTSENLTEAESSIRDTDMASEMMNYTKFNILQQAAQSMLAQANQQPQGILQLLG